MKTQKDFEDFGEFEAYQLKMKKEYRKRYERWSKIRYKVYQNITLGYGFFFATSKSNWNKFLKTAAGTNQLVENGDIKFIGFQKYLPIGSIIYSKRPKVWYSENNQRNGKRKKDTKAKA